MDLSAATFIVRLARSGTGTWTGAVERVRAGEKHRIGDIGAAGRFIAQMVAAESGEETMTNVTNAPNPRATKSNSRYHSNG